MLAALRAADAFLHFRPPICRFNASPLENVAPHPLQGWLRIPVWVKMCRFKSCFLMNFLGQKVHKWGRWGCWWSGTGKREGDDDDDDDDDNDDDGDDDDNDGDDDEDGGGSADGNGASGESGWESVINGEWCTSVCFCWSSRLGRRDICEGWEVGLSGGEANGKRRGEEGDPIRDSSTDERGDKVYRRGLIWFVIKGDDMEALPSVAVGAVEDKKGCSFWTWRCSLFTQEKGTPHMQWNLPNQSCGSGGLDEVDELGVE